MINVSIVVCTRNRAQSLLNALQSLLQLETENRLRYEIVVINNNSTDHTSDVVRDLKATALIDVREFVEELAIEDWHKATLAHAGLVGDLIPIRAKVRISQTGAVKSSEIIEAICQHLVHPLTEPLPHRAVRLALHAGDTSPMHKVRAQQAPAPNVC